MRFASKNISEKALAPEEGFFYNEGMQKISQYSLVSCSHFVFTAFPYEDLGVRGFTLDSSLDKEDHGVITQTLLVNSPTQSAVSLEFREIADEEEFLLNLKKNASTVRGRDVLRPGLGFYGPEAAQLSLGAIPVQVLSQQKALREAKSHANTVKAVWGLYLGLDAKGIQEWTLFLGNPPTDGAWVLEDGVRIEIAKPGDGVYEFMEARKDFPFWAVILKCESFTEFEKIAEPERLFQWQNKPAALIKEHLTDWDILVL